MDCSLTRSISRLAHSTRTLNDSDLERAWVWGDYDEGIRFAFFLTYQQLRALAVELAARRLSAGLPVTPAQHILGVYHQAFRDLDAILLGVDDLTAGREPALGEWSLRDILVHILQAARSFFTVCVYARERLHSASPGPLAISDETWDDFWHGDEFASLSEIGSFTEIYDYWRGFHRRVLDAFADASEADLEAPSVFWETTPMPVRFRLHRFDAHLRQHTIQMEKALPMLGMELAETWRLRRMIFAALAEVESLLLGVGDFGLELCEQLASEIEARRVEIEAILQGEYHARPPD